MRTAVISFGCKIALTSGPKSLVDNKLAFDLCAFYMAQLGEKVKLLTDDTYKDLNSTVNLQIFKYFRNLIDHDYDSVNRSVLRAYIELATSNTFLNCIKGRIAYCNAHART